MTHLPGVMAAWEPDGGIELQLGPLHPYLSASQNLVTFPNGSSLPLGPLEVKRGIMRELLGDMGGGLGLMFPPFHWSLLHWTEILWRPEWLRALEEQWWWI
jgi:hypothetical protein